MIDFRMLIPGLLGGLVIGLLFFGSLRWTIGQLEQVERPAAFFLLSFLVRTIIALTGFYLVAAGSWQRLLVATVGFFVARVAVVNLATFKDSRITREVKAKHGTQS